MISSHNKEIWIKKGYEIFASIGQNGLKIEPLAKSIGKSKSSFYHYFADLELFLECLMIYHIEQCKIVARKERNAKNIDPELIHILLEHKTDLLFNRQLRIHQNVHLFAATLEESNKQIGDAFLNVGICELGINLSKKKIEELYKLAVENFFLQINIHTINYQWLSEYFKNLKAFASSLN